MQQLSVQHGWICREQGTGGRARTVELVHAVLSCSYYIYNHKGARPTEKWAYFNLRKNLTPRLVRASTP